MNEGQEIHVCGPQVAAVGYCAAILERLMMMANDGTKGTCFLTMVLNALKTLFFPWHARTNIQVYEERNLFNINCILLQWQITQDVVVLHFSFNVECFCVHACVCRMPHEWPLLGVLVCCVPSCLKKS